MTKTIGDLRPLKVGDRIRATGHEYLSNGRTQRSSWRGVFEVARIEERGIVCDLMFPRGDGTWRNGGHRFLYEWDEKYAELEKI